MPGIRSRDKLRSNSRDKKTAEFGGSGVVWDCAAGIAFAKGSARQKPGLSGPKPQPQR